MSAPTARWDMTRPGGTGMANTLGDMIRERAAERPRRTRDHVPGPHDQLRRARRPLQPGGPGAARRRHRTRRPRRHPRQERARVLRAPARRGEARCRARGGELAARTTGDRADRQRLDRARAARRRRVPPVRRGDRVGARDGRARDHHRVGHEPSRLRGVARRATVRRSPRRRVDRRGRGAVLHVGNHRSSEGCDGRAPRDVLARHRGQRRAATLGATAWRWWPCRASTSPARAGVSSASSTARTSCCCERSIPRPSCGTSRGTASRTRCTCPAVLQFLVGRARGRAAPTSRASTPSSTARHRSPKTSS